MSSSQHAARPVGPSPYRPTAAHLLASEWRDPPAYRFSHPRATTPCLVPARR